MGALENDLDYGLNQRREAYKRDHPDATITEILREGWNYNGSDAVNTEKRSVFDYDHDTVINKIDIETSRAHEKHGFSAPQANDLEALAILVEEVGEIAAAICQNQPKKEVEKEIVQVASVAIRWLMGDMRFSRKA